MSARPSAKTGYTVLAGAAITIIVWIVTAVAGVEVPEVVAAAATTLVAGAIALLVPARSGKFVDLANFEDWDPVRDGRMVDHAADAPETEDA